MAVPFFANYKLRIPDGSRKYYYELRIISMPNLAKILLYPIKSLDTMEVEKATILPGGALSYDREFAIIDAQAKFVNSKRDAKIHLLRSEFSLQERVIHLQFPGGQSPRVFHLHEELTPI